MKLQLSCRVHWYNWYFIFTRLTDSFKSAIAVWIMLMHTAERNTSLIKQFNLIATSDLFPSRAPHIAKISVSVLFLYLIRSEWTQYCGFQTQQLFVQNRTTWGYILHAHEFNRMKKKLVQTLIWNLRTITVRLLNYYGIADVTNLCVSSGLALLTEGVLLLSNWPISETKCIFLRIK